MALALLLVVHVLGAAVLIVPMMEGRKARFPPRGDGPDGDGRAGPPPPEPAPPGGAAPGPEAGVRILVREPVRPRPRPSPTPTRSR